MNQRNSQISTWLPACAVALFSLLGYAWITLSVHHITLGKPIALVFPPTWTAADILQAGASLDADILSFGNTHFVLIVMPRTQDLLDNLGQSGAFFAMNANFRLICGSVAT